ncbi:MAG: hypothetical protein LAT81_07010 [Oceanicaulis sp.]|nr:hypothetical protein [Oceanicaulis sp.]
MTTLILFSALISIASTFEAESCPEFSLDELRPASGSEFVYLQRREGNLTGRAIQLVIHDSGPERIQVDMSFRGRFGESPATPYRTHAGLILLQEAWLDGGSARQIFAEAPDRETFARELRTGDELRIPIREAFRMESGELLEHSGDYIIRHAGCGTLKHAEEVILTRKIELDSFAFAVQDDGEARLTRLSQVHDIPVGTNWYVSQYRTGDGPMENGLLLEGYDTP